MRAAGNERTTAQQTDRIGVLQVTDSLGLGGAERVAVNLANRLPRERYRNYVCSTREEGELARSIEPDVGRLELARRTRLDEPRAAWQLARYVRRNDIRIVHCHKDTIFLAALAAPLMPGRFVIWHDHFGEYAFLERPAWLYRLANWRTRAILSVNEPLVAWAIEALGFPRDRVHYVPNFVLAHTPGEPDPALPGVPGGRIVNVANLRLQKDQLNLIRALPHVLARHPDAHLLLVGGEQGGYGDRVRAEIASHGLERHVSILGPRTDVQAILSKCDVGVLSSESEGLPLSLIEYGMAGLPSVSTRVGQCPDVLADGAAGLLVPPKDPEALARGLNHLLGSAERRAHFAKVFRRHSELHYGPETGVRKVTEIYDRLLAQPEAM